ncbi:ISL3 family transposase [Actinomadura madurae]|nr:ISL3 family transposase [Actinomadura madurae]URN10786.1 ISL3 family transposase [Actinomadura madurae]
MFRSCASVRIRARTETAEAECPGCGTRSRRQHSHYERRLSDTAVGGQGLLIHLRVHRFLCRNHACSKQTFAEQVPGLTIRYGRRSAGASTALHAIALALGGRAGARLAHRLAPAVSRMTLIRLIRQMPEPAVQVGPRVLGVDDFALRRGHTYGTVLIDLVTGRPIDVLTDRAADTLAAWLKNHPGVEIICRDRAGGYADGASRGAPDAIQVADRWHMWRNLGDAVERTVARHRDHLRNLPLNTAPAEPAASPGPAVTPADPAPLPVLRTGPFADQIRQRHAAIHDLLAHGHDLRSIARTLGVARNTVRRFARPPHPRSFWSTPGPATAPDSLMTTPLTCFSGGTRAAPTPRS